jgi:hypothetical protein
MLSGSASTSYHGSISQDFHPDLVPAHLELQVSVMRPAVMRPSSTSVPNLKEQLQARPPFNVDAVLSAKPDGQHDPYWTTTLQALWQLLMEEEYD